MQLGPKTTSDADKPAVKLHCFVKVNNVIGIFLPK